MLFVVVCTDVICYTIQEELQGKVTSEQTANSGASAILDAMESQEELAGDPTFLKQPGTLPHLPQTARYEKGCQCALDICRMLKCS